MDKQVNEEQAISLPKAIIILEVIGAILGIVGAILSFAAGADRFNHLSLVCITPIIFLIGLILEIGVFLNNAKEFGFHRLGVAYVGIIASLIGLAVYLYYFINFVVYFGF